MNEYTVKFIDENGGELAVMIIHDGIIPAMLQVTKMVENRQKSNLPNFIGMEISVLVRRVFAADIPAVL